MKKITLEKILWSLEDMQYEVKVPAPIAERATASVSTGTLSLLKVFTSCVWVTMSLKPILPSSKDGR